MFLKSSCHTLLDTDQRVKTQAAPHVSSESSSSRSLGSGTSGDGVKLPSRQASDETTSPDYDFSTSSLISCSEHYNGDSLVDHGQMSPQSPSSPDTPEWSLIANGDSFHKVNHCYCVVLLLFQRPDQQASQWPQCQIQLSKRKLFSISHTADGKNNITLKVIFLFQYQVFF